MMSSEIGLLDATALRLLGGVGVILILATAIAWLLSWRLRAPKHEELLTNLRQRIYAWWVMIAVLFGSLAIGELATILLFVVLSLLALREFLTLAPVPSRRGFSAPPSSSTRA